MGNCGGEQIPDPYQVNMPTRKRVSRLLGVGAFLKLTRHMVNPHLTLYVAHDMARIYPGGRLGGAIALKSGGAKSRMCPF